MYIIASPVGAIWFVKPYFFLGIDPWAWRVETINKKPPIRTPSGPVAFWLDEEEARLSVTNVREEMAHVTLELGKQVGWYHGINKASLLLPCLSSCVKEHERGNGLHLRWTALLSKCHWRQLSGGIWSLLLAVVLSILTLNFHLYHFYLMFKAWHPLKHYNQLHTFHHLTSINM